MWRMINRFSRRKDWRAPAMSYIHDTDWHWQNTPPTEPTWVKIQTPIPTIGLTFHRTTKGAHEDFYLALKKASTSVKMEPTVTQTIHAAYSAPLRRGNRTWNHKLARRTHYQFYLISAKMKNLIGRKWNPMSQKMRSPTTIQDITPLNILIS